MITALTAHALLTRWHVRQFIHVQKFNPYTPQTPVFNIENKIFKNSHFCDFHNLPPLVPQRYFPACLRALLCHPGYKLIHIGAKLYSLGRAKVFSSVATNFGLKTYRVVHDVAQDTKPEWNTNTTYNTTRTLVRIHNRRQNLFVFTTFQRY